MSQMRGLANFISEIRGFEERRILGLHLLVFGVFLAARRWETDSTDHKVKCGREGGFSVEGGEKME
eukprot:320446-Amorphochlora_amoeboformis.AAC.1